VLPRGITSAASLWDLWVIAEHRLAGTLIMPAMSADEPRKQDTVLIAPQLDELALLNLFHGLYAQVSVHGQLLVSDIIGIIRVVTFGHRIFKRLDLVHPDLSNLRVTAVRGGQEATMAGALPHLEIDEMFEMLEMLLLPLAEFDVSVPGKHEVSERIVRSLPPAGVMLWLMGRIAWPAETDVGPRIGRGLRTPAALDAPERRRVPAVGARALVGTGIIHQSSPECLCRCHQDRLHRRCRPAPAKLRALSFS